MVDFEFIRVTFLTGLLVFLGRVCANSDVEYDILQPLFAKMDTMQAKIAKLEKSEANLKQSIGALIGTTAQFRLQITDLTKRLEASEKSQKENEELIKLLQNGQSKCHEADFVIKSEESDIKFKNAGRMDLANEVEQKQHRRIRQTPETVAFTAYLDHVIRNLGKDQPVVYNQVLLNDGGAYSEKTGIFRVPVSGVYLLSWSITARKLPGEHAYDVWVKLLVNGVHKTGAVAESRSDTDDNQGSNSVVLRLSQADEVWTAHYSSYPALFGDDGERTTSFMGVLLYTEQ